MVLKLDGNSDHVVRLKQRKQALFYVNVKFATAVDSNRSSNYQFHSTREHHFLISHVLECEGLKNIAKYGGSSSYTFDIFPGMNCCVIAGSIYL